MVSSKPWKAEAILQLLLGMFACLSLGVLVVELAIPGGAAAKGEWRMAGLLINALCLQGGAVVLIGYFLKQHGVGWREAFGFGSPRLRLALCLAPLAACVAVPVTWFLGEFSQWVMIRFHSEPQMQQTVQALKSTEAPDQQLYFAIVAIVMAPIIEEILFRGILYPYIKQNGYPRAALWGTSFAFALVHFNVPSFVPLLVFALILTALYEQTNNLLTPILTHSLFNLINFAWLMYPRG